MSLSRLGTTLCLLLAVALPAAVQTQTKTSTPLPELLTQQRWPEALTAIDQALKSRPKDADLLMNRGAVLSNLNRDAEALRVFQTVATANPKLPAAHNNMAVILAAMGRYDEARAALQKAIQAQPDYATAHENLGDLHAHQAAQAYRRALEIDAGSKTAKSKLNLANDIITLATGPRPAASIAAVPTPRAASSAPSAPTAPAKAASGVAARPATSAASTLPASATAAAPPDVEAVEAAVRAWQRAWSRRDGARYVAAYADDYRGGTDTPEIWRELAQKRLRERSTIRVDIAQLAVEVEGDTARARFEQSYESDQPGSRMRTRKTLVFQKIQGRWLIREELRN